MHHLAADNVAGKKLSGRNVKRTMVFLLIAFFALQATPAQSSEIQEKAQAVTAPIVIKATEMAKMNVTFKHSSHKAVSCATCHHNKPENSDTRYVSCATCHVKKGARQRHHMSAFMAFHAKDSMSSCFGCHRKKRIEQPQKYATMFNGCNPCHTSATVVSK